jgi:hypothetical protein
MQFSLEEIKEAWAKYDKGTIFGLYKNGKWEYMEQMPPGALGAATKAEMRKLKDAYDFPEYLEKKWIRQ